MFGIRILLQSLALVHLHGIDLIETPVTSVPSTFLWSISSHFSKVVDVQLFFFLGNPVRTVIVDTCRYDISIPTSTGPYPRPTHLPATRQAVVVSPEVGRRGITLR